MKKKVLAIVMAALLALSSVGALAYEVGKVTVQGVGVVQLDADTVTICVGVREVSSDVASAQATVNERIDAIVKALADMGVGKDAVSTDSIGIYPNYDYSDDEVITGYTAYNSLRVVVKDVDDAGAYIDAAFSAGANSLDYVDFSASDTAEAGSQALALAVESARAKAEVLAQAAGAQLGQIVEIVENPDGYYGDTTAYARVESAKDAGGGTQLLASKQQVTASVNVTFEFTVKSDIG